MNLLYEKLIADFIAKADIERDALLIADILRATYPVGNLPVEKTVKRFIDGETAKPREALLGFMAAYVLGKTLEEVETANQNTEVGTFFQTFREDYERALAKRFPEESNNVLLEQLQAQIKKLKGQVRVLSVTFGGLLFLFILAFFLYSYSNQKPSLAGMDWPNMITIKGGTFLMGDTFKDSKKSAFKDETPTHEVKVDSFEMSDTEITFKTFDLYCLYRKKRFS